MRRTNNIINSYTDFSTSSNIAENDIRQADPDLALEQSFSDEQILAQDTEQPSNEQGAEQAAPCTEPNGETAVNIPAETAGNNPAETAGNTLAETAGNTLAETAGNIPAETDGNIPAETDGNIPAEIMTDESPYRARLEHFALDSGEEEETQAPPKDGSADKAFREYRRKLTITLILAAITFLCVIAAAVLSMIGSGKVNASADTVSNSAEYRYQLDVDLSFQVYSNESRVYSVYLYGDSAGSAAATLESGAMLCFAPTTVEIVIPEGKLVTQYASVKAYGRIYDFSLSGPVSFSNASVYEGSTTAETSITYRFTGLTDGTYTISFTKDEYSYTSTSVGGTQEGYSAAVTTSFTFSVDTTAPEISGASADPDNPLYTNTSFTVSATDALSGVNSLGYQTPGASSFIWASGSERTFSISGSKEGLYKFAARDEAGNTTGYYYVCLDATAPEITLKGADSGGVTDSSFSVTATDGTGTQTLYYCRTETGSWISVASGKITIPYTNGDGEYCFYATDAAGNTSEKYYVTLSTADIEGFFVKNDSDNSMYFYWSNANWTATLDGEPYERYTWITAEGAHEIILTSRYGDTLEYSCYIDHYYVAAGYREATCSEQGCTIYECVHCGDTYEADFTPAAKHDYRAIYTMPTCTEEGFMTYTCAVCGSSYTEACTPATGHYYTRTIVEPTCESEGYCLYECIVCHDTYATDYTEETDHDYICTYTAPTCTTPGLYTYICSVCGDSYVEESGLPTDHTYEITVIKTPTCTEDGERYYRCTVCGYDFYVTVPALGHSYVIESQYTVDGDTMRVYVCPDCGVSYTEDLGNQTEYVASFVDELFSAYSSYMWWILLAVAGIWSIVMGVMYIKARRAEDKDKARRMLVNYLLGLVIIAAIIVAAPYLAYGIASLAA
ncbi:MAG: pilin [Clostridia bacterium]|nr:pilin [Clostridia bacterium]